MWYCEILLQFKITAFYWEKSNLFLWWQSWILTAITQVFSVTWSFRNHSNLLIWCSRNISYYQCWKHLCCLIFSDKWWYMYLISVLWWMEISKEEHSFEIEMISNILNIFTVTFELFSAFAFLLNSFFLSKIEKEILTKHFNGIV